VALKIASSSFCISDHLFHGGAARAANRWFSLLNSHGWNVQRIAGDSCAQDTLLLTGKPRRGIWRLGEYLTSRRNGRKKKVDFKLEEILQEKPCSFIWFHNIAGGEKWGWSEEMVAVASKYAPVLWTLHDMWALGNDDLSYWEVNSGVESGRWKGAEQSGPKVKRCQGEKAGSREKSRVSRVCGEVGIYPVTLTAPSKWLADLTNKLTGHECAFLPNPIDLKTFSPGDRACLPAAMGAARGRRGSFSWRGLFGRPKEGV